MITKFTFGAVVTNWNNYTNTSIPNAILIADLVEDDGSTATGISFRSNGAYSFSAGDRASGEFWGWPEAVWDDIAFESGGDMQYQFAGLTPYIGQSYTLRTAHFSNSVRNNDVTVDGTTLQYNSVSGDPVEPLEFTGTISADTLVIDIERVTGTTVTYFTGFTLELTASTGLTIDTEPTESRVNSQSSFTVSGAATAPTTLNTTIALGVGGPTIVPDSVTGSDPYVINYTPPTSTNKLFNATGYVHRITVDSETVDSSIIPYLPETGHDFVNVGTPDTGTDIYNEYAGGTFATGDQAVWAVSSTPSGSVVTIDDTLNWDINPAPVINQLVGIYRIASNDTRDVDDIITFVAVTAPVLSSPTGGATGAFTASGSVTTDTGNGTLYYYASQNASETASTIKLSGSTQAVNASGVQGVSVGGLLAETTYYLHYVQDDSGATESNVVNSASFTTQAAPAPGDSNIVTPVVSGIVSNIVSEV